MSTTVLDALRNAKFNLETLGKGGLRSNPIHTIAMEQLSNAISSLENGLTTDDVIQEDMFGDVDVAPPRKEASDE